MIDLMLTNKRERSLKAKTVETGLSDFHKMVVSVFKTSFKKQKPKIVTYRDYKRFDNEKFKESLTTYFSIMFLLPSSLVALTGAD